MNPTDTELLDFQAEQRITIRPSTSDRAPGWAAIDQNHGPIAVAQTPREALLAAYHWARGTK